MRKYELVVVLNGSLSEADVKAAQKKYEELLSSNGAVEVSCESWGRREVAYEVKKTKHGHYLCFYFESADSDIVAAVSEILRIDESVLLHQAHRLSERSRKFKGRLTNDDDSEENSAVA